MRFLILRQILIVNDIIISLNTHITDVLIVEVLTDSPLLIIKENINCGNFLNNNIFNFLIDKINYNSLTDFPVNERLYGETLFHIFLQIERYSIAYRTNRIIGIYITIIDLVNILKFSHSNTSRLYHDTTTTQQEHKGVQRKVYFIINVFLAFPIKHFERLYKRTLTEKLLK